MSAGKTTELYDFPLSIYCQMVRVALAEKGADYEIKRVDITQKGEQFERCYLDLNPRAVVPTLVVDGGVHVETKNILRRIEAEVSGPALVPEDAAARAEMDAWMKRSDDFDYAGQLYATKVTPDGKCPPLLGRLAKLREIRARHPELAGPMDDRIEENLALQPRVSSKEWQAELRDEIRASLVELDVHLNGRTFIAGERYSLADVMWTATLARFALLGIAFWADGALPNVARYYESLKGRPSWTEGNVIDTMPAAFAGKSAAQAPPVVAAR